MMIIQRIAKNNHDQSIFFRLELFEKIERTISYFKNNHKHIVNAFDEEFQTINRLNT